MAGHLTRAENTSPALEAYLRRWRSPLDAFALCTLWLVMLPLSTIGPGDDAVLVAILGRAGVSGVFAVDLIAQARRAPRSWQYVRQHPLALLAIPVPPVRIVFSLRLITSLFRRGHMQRFLLAAVLLLLNGSLIVYFAERRAPGANITTIGDALWWSVVTVTTVGYGDVYPVTLTGRIAAVGIMIIGLLTLAVITAQVSASFADQVEKRGDSTTDAAGDPTTSDETDVSVLADRLDRIEALLAAAAGGPEAPDGVPGTAGTADGGGAREPGEPPGE